MSVTKKKKLSSNFVARDENLFKFSKTLQLYLIPNYILKYISKILTGLTDHLSVFGLFASVKNNNREKQIEKTITLDNMRELSEVCSVHFCKMNELNQMITKEREK